MSDPLPARVLAWYGDDFTGSTDVLEVLAQAGLEPVLFVEPPSGEALGAFPAARAIGLAGVSRARDPSWMDASLPAAFDALLRFGAPLLHYKVCSTFDSSPAIGSIGRAIEIGRRSVRASGATPVVVGAPALGRYTAFGHLFAAAGDATWRIDRHPTMSRHPVTPMREADLVRHLGAQTSRAVRSFDLVALKAPDYAERYARVAADDGALILDVLDDETLRRAGELAWRDAARARFVAGSSGLEYALVAYWRSAHLLPPAAEPVEAGEVDRLLVVSGSCSPATAGQIDAAERAGYARLALDPVAALARDGERALESIAARAAAAWTQCRGVVVHSALGPDDPSIARARAAAGSAGLAAGAAGRRIGEALGRVLAMLVERLQPQRVLVAGGDTSGEAAQRLGIAALTMIAPLAPGSPLCRAHAPGRAVHGLQVVLKGGQVGSRTFFEDARRARAPGPRAALPSATGGQA